MKEELKILNYFSNHQLNLLQLLTLRLGVKSRLKMIINEDTFDGRQPQNIKSGISQ